MRTLGTSDSLILGKEVWPCAVGAVLLLLAGLMEGVAAGTNASVLWTFPDARELQRTGMEPWVQPRYFMAVRPDYVSLRALLARAGTERPEQVIAPTLELELPMPDGSLARFLIVESPVMAPELAAEFPEIKTYRGQGVDDPRAGLRLDVTPAGVHAQILSPGGAVYLDPYWKGNRDLLVSYYKRDLLKAADDFECHVRERSEPAGRIASLDRKSSGGTLRTYRLACSATAEYTAYHGGTVADGQAAIVTAINRVTGVYEQELAIRLVLVANNSALVFTNAAADPFTNDDSDAMLDQNQAASDSLIGSANYDVGHVFSTGGGGLAMLRAVCVDGQKAQGVTGSANPTGDGYWIDYVAHELGHEFGANHTFNSSLGSCSGNRVSSTAYEPGSGSTIMAYAGICTNDNLQPHTDPYFHFASYEEIMDYTTSGGGASCPSNSATGNSPPTVGVLTGCSIPCSTPFMLTASGSDPDGDAVTYCWEEADLGPSITLLTGDNGSSPLFRSFSPTNDAFRMFPCLAAILSATTSTVERLPTTTRSLKFVVTVRDNRSGGGGVNSTSVTVYVVSNAGPFRVESPNTAQTCAGRIAVAWQVNGTTSAPVNCAAVDILLSTDGGLTFPAVLASNTPNDGAESVLLPYLATNQARIKVQARNNIFFDVSDTHFSIVPGSPVVVDHVLFSDAGGNANGVVEPGERIEEAAILRNISDASVGGITAVVSTADAGIALIQDVSAYPDIAAGALGTNTIPFSYRVAKNVPCGSLLTFAILTFSSNSVTTDTFVRTLGQSQYGPPQTGSLSSADVPMFIADLATNVSLLTLPVTGIVEDLDVNLRIDHAFDGDIRIVLRHPDETEVTLSNQRGGSGRNYGTGDCGTGTNTTFDDEAATGIENGVAPFAGYFRPEGTLSDLDGKTCEGAWQLRVYDGWGADPGTCLCWSVRAVYRAQETICSIYDQAPEISAGSLTPAVPSTTQDLVAAATTSDPDDDPVTITYAWQTSTDEVSFAAAGGSDSNYPAAATVAGWSYRCLMTPSDGYLNGGAWTTASVRILEDSDNDNLNDDWEMDFFHSLYAQAGGGDADDDDVVNLDEFLAGTDPTNGQSCLILAAPPIGSGSGGLVVRWQSVTSRNYTLTRATNLIVPSPFNAIQTNIAGQAGITIRTDDTATAAGPYLYRVETKP